MSNIRVPPFSPGRVGNTVSAVIGITASTLNFDNPTPTPGGAFAKGNTVRLFNAGPNVVFVDLVGAGTTPSATVTNSMPLPVGAVEKFTTAGATAVTAITSTGTSTLFATVGEGL